MIALLLYLAGFLPSYIALKTIKNEGLVEDDFKWHHFLIALCVWPLIFVLAAFKLLGKKVKEELS